MQELEALYEKMRDERTVKAPTTIDGKRVITYSMLQMFLACRYKCKLRYFDYLAPIDTPKHYVFGSAVHKALETWFDPETDWLSLDHRKSNTIGSLVTYPLSNQDKLKASALIECYMKKYGAKDQFQVKQVEQTFTNPIISNDGEVNQDFIFMGKPDGLVMMDNEYYILEHKTAGAIDDTYLSKIELDAQIHIYAINIMKALNIKVVGAIYDILKKSKLSQSEGETHEQYEARYAELCSTNKSGKSTAKRKMPESDDDFLARVKESIDPETDLVRVIIKFDDDKLKAYNDELWSIICDVDTCANKQEKFYKNRGNCGAYNSLCPYHLVCKKGCYDDTLSDVYMIKEPNEELASESTED